jgi:uncharacterized membrane protein
MVVHLGCVGILGSLFKGNVEALAVGAVMVVLLVGFWNLKRWAVLVYAGQAVFFVLNATHRFGASYPLGVLVGAVVHLLILGPALAHWRRMTWI